MEAIKVTREGWAEEGSGQEAGVEEGDGSGGSGEGCGAW